MKTPQRKRFTLGLLQQLGILLFVSLLIFAPAGISHAASHISARAMIPAAVPTLYLTDSNIQNQSDDLYAIDATNGSTRWRTTIPFDGDASMPFTGFGNVYVNNGNARAFTAAGLTPLWTQNIDPDARTTPVGGSGNILFGGARDFEARTASTGALVWRTALPDDVSAAAVVATVQGQSRVYFGTGSSDTVYALDPGSGTILWQQHLITTDDDIRVSSPTVDVARGLVYVCSEDDRVYALDAVTGHIVWNVLTGGALVAAPRVANDVVYVQSLDGVYALRADNGERIWLASVGSGAATSVIAGNLVYVVTDQKQPSGTETVFALNASNGHIVWSFRLLFPSVTTTGLALANGLLYVIATSLSGSSPLFVSVYAINASSGVEFWRWDGVPHGNDTTTGASAPPIIVV